MPDRASMQLGGVHLDLLAGRGAFRPDRRTVYVADLHLGKAATFRAAGVAAPETTTMRDLDALSALVEECKAERLVVLGDAVHAKHGLRGTVRIALDVWIEHRRQLEIVCLRGNHDRSAGLTDLGPRVRIIDEPFEDDGLTLVHDPDVAPAGAPALAGHVHPGVKLGRGRGPTRMGMRARCYWLRAQTLIVPAFGRFTGLKIVKPRPGDRVWAVGDDSVIEMPVGTPTARV